MSTTRLIARAASLLCMMMAFAATSSSASELTFTADLSGKAASSMTGSKATGHATIFVNTERQTVKVLLDVVGLKPSDLWTKLRESPKGPIHLHIYESRDRSGAAALIFPVPYGLSYVATSKGFEVATKSEPYAPGAKLVGSTASFDEFLSALQNGRLVLNVHTNAKPAGEISGDVVPSPAAPQPR